MSLIWATRGRDWGFQFLENGGERDPLPIYKAAFENQEQATELVQKSYGLTAARILDPLGRTDHAGRIIPHDFVLRGQMSEGINSPEDVREIIWPLVAEHFQEIWDRPDHH
ncbi:hypothetical protein SFC07_07255 [Corynebacterium callunae]|uniref:hypothetical protein n=1 Tax=Corynebacterium callunae TaxID=1721 RepID=UPI0039819EC7